MAVTISANGLTICHKGSKGKAMATIPDVCKIPAPPGGPIPIPFPNISESKDLDMGSITVKADGGNSICVLGSKFTTSKGDDGGILGGIVSGTTNGEAMCITFSPDVTVEGRPVCRKTDKMLMNMSPTPNTICLQGIDQPDISVKAEDSEWIKIRVLDPENEEPVEGVHMKVTLPDGAIVKTISRSNGIISFEGLEAGSCDIELDEEENPRYGGIPDDCTKEGLATKSKHIIYVTLNQPLLSC